MQPAHGAAQESGFTQLCLVAIHNTTGFVLNFSLELVFDLTRRLGTGKYYSRARVLKRLKGAKPPFRNPALGILEAEQSNAGFSSVKRSHLIPRPRLDCLTPAPEGPEAALCQQHIQNKPYLRATSCGCMGDKTSAVRRAKAAPARGGGLGWELPAWRRSQGCSWSAKRCVLAT